MSLHLYKPLGSNDESVRLSTAHTLTTELTTLLTTERTPQSKKDVDYALSRLTKGLSSGSNSSRPGFAIVLTEFLASLQSSENPAKWDISLTAILSAVKANTTPQSGHTTRPEERGYHLGRLFGLQSILQSGITAAPGSEAEAAHREVLDELFELAKRKPWLRESCAWAVCESVQRGVGAGAAAATYSALAESGMSKTTEGVAVWLCVAAYHPGVVAPREVWSGGLPLGAGNLGVLGKILKDSGEEEGGGGAAKGTWSQKLHFVWDFILAVHLAEEGVWSELRKSSEVAGWAELWRAVVDESLFSTSASEERKFHGFLLFAKALEQTTPSTSQHLSALFTKNFMRSLINQLSDASRYLHKAAAKCARALLAKAEAAPWSAPIIVTQLIANNGTPSFDSLTKGKHVEKILCLADEDGLVEVVRVLRGIMLAPGVDEVKTAEVRRQWACDQILSVVRSSKSVKSGAWLKEVVELFTAFGHFDVQEGATPSVSASSQGMFRSRLMSCLSHLITLKDTADGDGTWPYRAVKTIGALKKTDGYKLAIDIDDVIAEALKSATKTLERIRKKRAAHNSKDSTKSSQLSSFELLYSLVILQVYAGETDALGVLDELQICYDKVVRKKGDDEDVDASQVLVEILLSFLSKPSVLLRKLAQQVFASFVDQITADGLEAMFAVLETKESLGGQQELFEGNDEDEQDDVDMGGSDDGEEDSDVEVVDAEGMDLDEEDASSDGEGSTSDDDSEDEEIDETEATKLESALAEALSASGAAANSDDDGSDMDDDAMLALDQHLVTIFKQRSAEKSKKAETRAAKETITNFKNRVLDLLDIFARSPRALDVGVSSSMVLPLLRCARRTASRPVAEHSAVVVRNFANSLRGKEADVVVGKKHEREALWSLLEEVHVEAAKDGGAGREKHKAACSQASIAIMKVLVASGGMKKEDVERAVGIYMKSLTKLLTDRTWRVQGGLFTDFINWAVTAGKRLQNWEVSK
ncbi:DNA polymerase phi-domain-containing protein [Morchella snyderi]|nr:DNA polymerase phi-domain-containing protein [Morchella snyderi]